MATSYTNKTYFMAWIYGNNSGHVLKTFTIKLGEQWSQSESLRFMLEQARIEINDSGMHDNRGNGKIAVTQFNRVD